MDKAIGLMLLARDGDKEAFAELYNLTHKRVYSFFYGLSRNAELSNDLSQDTFLRIWKFRDRYAATGSFPAYLLSFARFVWLEHCRSNKKSSLSTSHLINDLIQHLSSRSVPSPDEYAFNHQLDDDVFSALQKLPEDQRTVFVLRVIEGLDAKETASILQCPINTVRSRKILAVKKLRSMLSSSYDPESFVEKGTST